jgi:GxxExxY protein
MASYSADTLTERVIACVIQVHQALGPGFKEAVYRRALFFEFELQGLSAEAEKPIFLYYKRKKVGFHRLDLLVEGTVIIELKTVEQLCKAHYAQMRSYLKATQLEVGLLINMASLKADVRRVQIRSPYPQDPHISI